MKMVKILLLSCLFSGIIQITSAQNYTEILGRPTDSAITLSILFDKSVNVYWEYGTTPGSYAQTTPIYTTIADTPIEVDFKNLMPNTKYYYRTKYRLANNGTYISALEHSFQTQRKPGYTFSFVVEADPHLDSNTNPDAYKLTLQHMLSKNPDFIIDLGDNAMSDKLPVIDKASIIDRTLLFRTYFNQITHSVPLFVTLGNHEGELGWLPNTDISSLPTMAALIRKTYFPNPFPNNFYSGNTVPEINVGIRENYYAWEWGNALFVVIDPYMYSKSKPEWGWSLGLTQYNWLKNTLANSKAKFKFLFSHQLVGGSGTEGRGGSEFAHLYEMGGRNTDSTFGFTTNRPGWDKPIHYLMFENKASIYFHGHDHLFAKQDKDGIVYQEVPQPSAKNITTMTGTPYGYLNGTLMPNRGYMYVTVSADKAQVDYIRTYLPSEENATRKNGEVAYSYSIVPSLITGVNDIISNDFIKVFPNPANNKIVVQPKDNIQNFQIRILNMMGDVMLLTKNKEIDSSVLPTGVYFVNFETDKFISSKKIVIQH
ncbi:MAG: hypothetical protein RIR64_457 [Bacteroidota bacterium]|jgi:hypothetical protein